jgi:type IV pilus assembly protein PilA
MIRRRRRSRKRDQRGLTLVELMIVVTIIAIIAAVAIAVYQDIVKKSKLAADQGTVASLRSAVAIYYGRTNGLFPATLGAVELLVVPAAVYNCTVPPVYDATNGKITFTAVVSDCP